MVVVPKIRLAVLVAVAFTSSACASSRYDPGVPGLVTAEAEETPAVSMAEQSDYTARGAINSAAQGGDAGATIGRQMDELAAELEESLMPGTTVERISEGIQVTIAAGSLYGFESSVIRGGESADLQKLATSLKKYPDTDLFIVAHTDDSGSRRYTEGLSTRRAVATSEYLAAQGVVMGRMKTLGRGKAEPVATNANEIGKRSNRRIEVAIYARATASSR